MAPVETVDMSSTSLFAVKRNLLAAIVEIGLINPTKKPSGVLVNPLLFECDEALRS